MKKLFIYLLIICCFILFTKCTRDGVDCNDGRIFVENLASLTPIQSQFQVNDTLRLSCRIPLTNNYYGFSSNFLETTSNPRALFLLGEGSHSLETKK
jgi:hypothetical protein